MRQKQCECWAYQPCCMQLNGLPTLAAGQIRLKAGCHKPTLTALSRCWADANCKSQQAHCSHLLHRCSSFTIQGSWIGLEQVLLPHATAEGMHSLLTSQKQHTTTSFLQAASRLSSSYCFTYRVVSNLQVLHGQAAAAKDLHGPCTSCGSVAHQPHTGQSD